MKHEHHHHHEHNFDDIASIKLAFFTNLVFTLVELVGGLFTNSISILSDALHDLGDSIGLGLAWYFQKLSHKDGDAQYSFGYQRFSILGALINGVVLIIGSIWIFQAAIVRIIHPEPTYAYGMIILAIFGIIFNGFAVFIMRKGDSHNENLISLHLLEDVLGWAAVLVGAIVIYFTSWYIIDPIMSIAIAIFIFYNAFSHLKDSIKIILEAVPNDIDYIALQKAIESIGHVLSVHDLHVWSMDGKRHIMSAHIVTDLEISSKNNDLMKKKITEITKGFNIDHNTLALEYMEVQC